MNSAVPTLEQRVYSLLADREVRSGAWLAQQLGVSRSAVWKAMQRLRLMGVEVRATRPGGYQLPVAQVPLQTAVVESLLSAAVRKRQRHGVALWSTASTNADLLQQDPPASGHFDWRVAEFQTAGRGRRARAWLAPPGTAVCLSMGWQFDPMPERLGTLSLAMGVCLTRALAQMGQDGVRLKWPNDLVIDANDRLAKLAGILIELRAESAGPAFAVVGIGMNVSLPASVGAAIAGQGLPPTDLRALGLDPCNRNALVAAIVGQCVEGLVQFSQHGFEPFAAEWRARDALAGRVVSVSGDQSTFVGHARGIDRFGALCVQTRDGLQQFISGEVSVREAAPGEGAGFT